MYEALLLSDTDVTTLRACLRDPRFSPLLAQVPGIAVALQQPQPDFDLSVLYDMYDAISEVRSNTNYPEDWNPLRRAVDTAIKRRRIFDEVKDIEQVPVETPVQAATTPSPVAPAQCFVIVVESIGSCDGPNFGAMAYHDFNQACAALDAQVKAEMAKNCWGYEEVRDRESNAKPEEDHLFGYVGGNAEKQTYWINVGSSRNAPRYCYFLQKFSMATPAEVSHAA